jgi:hypothetical protein
MEIDLSLCTSDQRGYEYIILSAWILYIDMYNLATDHSKFVITKLLRYRRDAPVASDYVQSKSSLKARSDNHRRLSNCMNGSMWLENGLRLHSEILWRYFRLQEGAKSMHPPASVNALGHEKCAS